jgi:putative FmdB family regulatory protein
MESPPPALGKAGNVPIYEFRCDQCLARTSVFVRTVSAAPGTVACERCGQPGARRVFSRVAVLRGEDALGFDESSLAGIDQDDPRSMAKWVRKMSRQMGEPLDAETESELDRMESGEMPHGGDEADDAFSDVN